MLNTFNPTEVKNSSGHKIRPVKVLTDEAREAMKRVELIDGVEKEKNLMRDKENRKLVMNHEHLCRRAILKANNKRYIVRLNVEKIKNMDEVEKTVHARAHFLYGKDGRGLKESEKRNVMDLNAEYVDDFKFEYIKRKALIDPGMMQNKKYDSSLAHNKYQWKGEHGRYKKDDVAPWFLIYNQTNINKLEEIQEPSLQKEIKMKIQNM